MIFLDITSQTWIVTLLGFTIVVLLLFCFIYIMKLLGWIMQKVSAPKKKEQPVQNNVQLESKATSGDEMAAVAIALHLYYNSLHDEESPRLTVKNHHTAWHIIQ